MPFLPNGWTTYFSFLSHLFILLFPTHKSVECVYKYRVLAAFPQRRNANSPFSFGRSSSRVLHMGQTILDSDASPLPRSPMRLLPIDTGEV